MSATTAATSSFIGSSRRPHVFSRSGLVQAWFGNFGRKKATKKRASRQSTDSYMQLGQSNAPRLSVRSKFKEVHAEERRSADYHPSIWDPKLIASFSTPYTYELHANRLEELKQETRRLLKSTQHLTARLKLIDTIQRLGVADHFEEEIKEALDLVYKDVTGDLFTTALAFRLLREHGYPVSSGVFDKFRNSDGCFLDSLSSDMAGILSLYEASYLGMQGEDILEEAKNFSTNHLKSMLGNLEINEAKQVQEALEIPVYWRMPREETRNFIEVYERDNTRSSVLLELAKLDYNLAQSVYHEELKELARWWRDLGFKEKLSFSRDRLMENFWWAMGACHRPQFSKCRIGITKFVCILTAIDDMYDIYGSLNELECFTDAVKRWDIEAMEDLPEYMKLCYLTMFNFANEMAYDALKNYEVNIVPYIKEAWLNLCESYLVEARWFYGGHKPSVEEYLANAYTSVGGPSAMVHACLLECCAITKELLESFKLGKNLIHWSSLITRLCDDLGTSSDEIVRGDVSKSIQCFMIEKGITEEEARDCVKCLIDNSWKKLNMEAAKCYIPKFMRNLSLNIARTAHCIFQYGDGIGKSDGVTKERLISLIINPIKMQ